MGVFGSIIRGVLTLLELGVWIYALLMIANGLMAILKADPKNGFIMFVHQLTEPLLNWLRAKFPKLKQDNIDFSPWLVVILLIVIKFIIINPLYMATFPAHRF